MCGLVHAFSFIRNQAYEGGKNWIKSTDCYFTNAYYYEDNFTFGVFGLCTIIEMNSM